MKIRFARSAVARAGIGLAIAAFAQLLAFLLAGAGHGWVTPWFASLFLWLLVPASLAFAWPVGRRKRLILWPIALAALGADFWLIKGTIDEGNALIFYLAVNGGIGLLIVALWLALWTVWQPMLFLALVTGRTSANADA